MKFFLLFLILITLNLKKNRKNDSYFSKTEKSIVLPLPPKFSFIDWESNLTPIVYDLIKIDLSYGKILIFPVSENKLQNFQIDELNYYLKVLISKSRKFDIISYNELKNVKNIFKISSNDNLQCCDKALKLSRYLKAKYLFYSYIRHSKILNITCKLILVDTKENLWEKTIPINFLEE